MELRPPVRLYVGLTSYLFPLPSCPTVGFGGGNKALIRNEPPIIMPAEINALPVAVEVPIAEPKAAPYAPAAQLATTTKATIATVRSILPPPPPPRGTAAMTMVSPVRGRSLPHSAWGTLCPLCQTSKSLRGNATADRKSTRLNSSHVAISYAVFCLKKKKTN